MTAKHPRNPNIYLLAGQPQGGRNWDGELLAGEDLVNHRMNIGIKDWAQMVNEGWRTKIDHTKEEIKELIAALQKYYDDLE